jgi:hypothetical protein
MLNKNSYIKRLPDGKYRVLSKKHRNLGTYDTKAEAEERLRQVEVFKHMAKGRKKALKSFRCLVKESEEHDDLEFSYSKIMRDLNKNHKDKVKPFMKKFKEVFDRACDSNIKNPEGAALIAAMYCVNYTIKKSEVAIPDRLLKISASVIEMGEPRSAGKAIADIVKFLTSRISIENRQKSLQGLKQKISQLNEFEISQKKTPASASLGQSITFIKTILNGHEPLYIREVLDGIVESL